MLVLPLYELGSSCLESSSVEKDTRTLVHSSGKEPTVCTAKGKADTELHQQEHGQQVTGDVYSHLTLVPQCWAPPCERGTDKLEQSQRKLLG